MPTLEQFQELLDNNATVFFCSRTAKSLQEHWKLLKAYQLLPDQSIGPFKADELLNFFDAEDLMLDHELINEPYDDKKESELRLAEWQQRREMRMLENELFNWNVMVESLSPIVDPLEFDNQTLAVLQGTHIRYWMRSKEITFGRDARDCKVDIDLSLEGPSGKVSRRHGIIKMCSNGDFFIENEGTRPLVINGEPLLSGNKMQLVNDAIVGICGLQFAFHINYDLIKAIRIESAKNTAILN